MVNVKKSAFILTTIQHLIPATFAGVVFLWLSPWTQPFFQGVASLYNAFLGITFAYFGLLWLVELLYSIPDVMGGGKQARAVSFGAVIFFAMMIASFAFAVILFQGWYKFNDPNINGILVGIAGLTFAAALFQARNILFHGRREYLLYLGKQ